MLTAIRKNGLTLAIFACATTGLVALTSTNRRSNQASGTKAATSVLNQ